MGVVTITDDNFDREVIASNLPVIVDFWASWCVDPESKVVVSPYGEQINADSVVVGQGVVGLKEDAISVGKVSRSLVVKDGGHCKEVVSETGRKVKVTDDHPFYTPFGWVAARELKKNDFIAVLPLGEPEDFQGVEARELILARLVGFLFTDGTLYYGSNNNYWEVSFSVGQMSDINQLKLDLEDLGFKKIHVKEVYKKQKIGGREFNTHLFKMKCLSKELFTIMLERGVPLGAKKSQEYPVPSWIKNGPRAVKREFLRGFLGGDGPKIDMAVESRRDKLPCNQISFNDLEFHKDPELKDSGLRFAREISNLLDDFGVVVSRVFAEEDTYLRADGKKSSIIHITFKKDFQNAYNYSSLVGYAYCKQKEARSLLVAEFIREVIYLRSKWQDVYKEVLNLASLGEGYKKIAKKLKISPSQTYSWIKGRSKATIAYHRMKFDSWLNERQMGAPNGFIWEKIDRVNKIFLPRVAQLTVDGTHSFVANGFLSHNCGPCLMAAPVVEELAGQYEGTVKVGKINVEEHSIEQGKYGVMAIPTVILFRGGKEIARQVGFAGKEGYEKLIQKGLG